MGPNPEMCLTCLGLCFLICEMETMPAHHGCQEEFFKGGSQIYKRYKGRVGFKVGGTLSCWEGHGSLSPGGEHLENLPLASDPKGLPGKGEACQSAW